MRIKYSDDLIRSVLDATPESPLGIRLARLCVEAKLPATYVAQVLDVSRMALHGWFRGKKIRASRVERIQTFMDLVKGDMERGVLPCGTIEGAKAYLQEMTDTPLRPTTKSAKSEG